MATCGHCQREITWATDPEGEAIALDNVASYDGRGRFTLSYPTPGARPVATPVQRPGPFAGYPRHSDVCGQGTPS